MIDRLESIEFEWEIKTSLLTWDEKFDLLKEYAKENSGGTSIPRLHKLRRWVVEQRTQNKLKEDGQGSNLTENHELKLNSIGFKWAVRNGKRTKKNAAPKKTVD